jgi:L,D-peptidoglycan transpeptidase YkuD (ErfK/YbiS/YcfS/YnhG family)
MTDGWCDDPSDPNYNKLITQPCQNDFEPMWRPDHVYDLLAVVGYNDAPVVPGAGSAIFLHVMRPPTEDHQWTAGCVSLELANLKAVLAACTPRTQIDLRAA